MADSVDPDQTAPLIWVREAVWSGSTLFAQTCVSENLGSLRYKICDRFIIYLHHCVFVSVHLFVFRRYELNFLRI